MSLGSLLLGSAAVQAVIVKIVADVLNGLFVKVDESKVGVKDAKYLKVVSVVLGVLVVAVNLSMSGHLADLNAVDVINKLIEAFAGILVAGSKPIKSVSQGLAGHIKNGFR